MDPYRMPFEAIHKNNSVATAAVSHVEFYIISSFETDRRLSCWLVISSPESMLRASPTR